MNQQTNFDEYLEKQLQDSDFAKRFKRAGQAWDVAFQLASLRKDAGLSQKKLARKVGTTQQQIRRLEPQQRAHSPWLAAGLASESKIRQNSLRGLRSTAGRQNFPVACCGELQILEICRPLPVQTRERLLRLLMYQICRKKTQRIP